jgi:hypothetical protein
VSKPLAIIPNKDIPRDTYRDVTPKLEAKALKEPLENLIIEAYVNNKLI